MPITRRKLIPVLMLATVVVALAVSWWVLINPDNALTRLFASKISNIDAKVVVGPYPVERDFQLLKANGVEVIVSLLDPAIPYEATLLKQEEANARQFGIVLRNFPMSSIMGKRFGNAYDQSASQAADTIAATAGKVYLHCYLGVHRIKVVRDLLTKRGIGTDTYAIRQAERESFRVEQDAAEASYAAGRYEEALAALTRVPEKSLTPDALLLKGWSLFRLGRIADARGAFGTVAHGAPDHAGAATGLGYCALRDAQFEEAQRQFQMALAKEPQNADALGGLGLAFYRTGRLADAEKYLEASLKQAPNEEWKAILARIRRR